MSCSRKLRRRGWGGCGPPDGWLASGAAGAWALGLAVQSCGTQPLTTEPSWSLVSELSRQGGSERGDLGGGGTPHMWGHGAVSTPTVPPDPGSASAPRPRLSQPGSSGPYSGGREGAGGQFSKWRPTAGLGLLNYTESHIVLDLFLKNIFLRSDRSTWKGMAGELGAGGTGPGEAACSGWRRPCSGHASCLPPGGHLDFGHRTF